MAQEAIDNTGEILRPDTSDELRGSIFAMGSMLLDTGWIGQRTFDNISVSTRQRRSGKISALRRPVELQSSKDPSFVINQDVLRSHASEFLEHFKGPLSEEEIRKLLVTYSAATAIGEFALRRHITDPSYARSRQRLVVISELFTDRTDFTEHFRSRVGDTALKGVMEAVDDSALVQINGLRAGLTIVRSASQESMEADFMTDDLVLACNAALEQYIGEVGPSYTGLADYLNIESAQGVNAFTYAIPEWLYVLGVPMPAGRLTAIFDEKYVSKIGEPDFGWSPSMEM